MLTRLGRYWVVFLDSTSENETVVEPAWFGGCMVTDRWEAARPAVA